jgi:hypothetical protein
MSRWTAHVLEAQGNLARMEGRHTDSRDAFERAFVINMQELGPGAGETLDVAMGLVSALSSIGPEAMNEATAIYLPIMALHPAEDTGGLPRSALPSPERAAEQLRQIVARAAERTAPDPSRAAAVARAGELTEEADAAFLDGRVGVAGDRLREAIALLEVARGPNDPSVVEPLQRLKLVMRVGGTESAVMPILERIQAVLADAYGSTHPLTIRALGEIYWQQRREYGPAGGKETADRIERDAHAALGPGHPVAQMISEIIAASRAAADQPGLGLYAEALSIRRERILAAPSQLADELLVDVGATAWASLDHAYGRAIDTPRHLRLLLADDEQVRNDALDLLAASLLLSGAVYPATVPAVRLVRHLAGDARAPGRPRLLSFLGVAATLARDADGPLAEELRAAVADLPTLLRLIVGSDSEAAVVEAATQQLAGLES